MPGAGCQLVQEDSQLGDRARRERERVAEDVVGQLLAVRRHYVLVVKTARVLNAVVTSTQAAVHTTHHHVLVVKTARVLWSMCAGHADEPST